MLVTQSIFEATDIPPPTSAWFRDSAHCVGHETRALLLKLLRTAAQNSLLWSHLVKCNRWTGNITETIEENQGSVQTKISSVTVREKLQLCQKLKFVNQVRIYSSHWVNSRVLVTKIPFQVIKYQVFFGMKKYSKRLKIFRFPMLLWWLLPFFDTNSAK